MSDQGRISSYNVYTIVWPYIKFEEIFKHFTSLISTSTFKKKVTWMDKLLGNIKPNILNHFTRKFMAVIGGRILIQFMQYFYKFP